MVEKAVYPGEFELANEMIENLPYTSLRKTRYASKLLEPCTLELISNINKEESLELCHKNVKYRSPYLMALNPQKISKLRIIHHKSQARKTIELFSLDKQLKYEYNLYRLLNTQNNSNNSGNDEDDSTTTVINSIVVNHGAIKSQIQILQGVGSKLQVDLKSVESKMNEFIDKANKKEPIVDSVVSELKKIKSQIMELDSKIPKPNEIIPNPIYPQYNGMMSNINMSQSSNHNSNQNNIQQKPQRKKKVPQPQVQPNNIETSSFSQASNQTGIGGYYSIMNKIVKERNDDY